MIQAFTIQAFFDPQGRHDDSEVMGLSGGPRVPLSTTEIGMMPGFWAAGTLHFWGNSISRHFTMSGVEMASPAVRGLPPPSVEIDAEVKPQSRLNIAKLQGAQSRSRMNMKRYSHL